ncbi:hypothetical protein DCAR_0935072 [Daucus carota subsp. sativus]|uniref:Uncharacterized protein n=1 Tax=Daucus carota subsp. sativus TaxID=79200 RepID=A0A175YG27_DAUCS|nr:hypothetical protein DCAR_0935072 [Daucus carota subsp. sativus]
MARSSRPISPLLLLDIDILLKICHLLQQDGFLDLFFLIQVWFRFQTPEAVTKLLHNLDWSRVHEVVEPFKNLECRVFNNFVKHTVAIGVKGALCYKACKNLIRGNTPTQQLNILRNIANDDDLCFLAYCVFKTHYEPSSLQQNGQILHQKISESSKFRLEFESHCRALNGRCRKYKVFWYDRPDIFPQNGVCSSYVSGKAHNMDPYGVGCSYKEILAATCSECMILMINYKIFRGY